MAELALAVPPAGAILIQCLLALSTVADGQETWLATTHGGGKCEDNVVAHADQTVVGAGAKRLPIGSQRDAYSSHDCLSLCCDLPECRFAVVADFLTGKGECELYACYGDQPCAVEQVADRATVTMELQHRKHVTLPRKPQLPNGPPVSVASSPHWLTSAARACATPLAVGAALLLLCACANAVLLGVILRRRKAAQGNWDAVQARHKQINGAQLGQGTLHAYNNVALQA